MFDSIQPSEEPIPLSGSLDPPQKGTKKTNKTTKRVIVLLSAIGVCGAITIATNQSGITKRFAPNVPVAESSTETPKQEPIATGTVTTETTETEGEFQPAPDLEIQRNELLDKSLDEVKFQINNLSQAVAEEFLLQAREATQKKPITTELFLIQKINFLAGKLDKQTLDGELTGSQKDREKAAQLLFEVWGNLEALKLHWDTTAGSQVQIKFTAVNASVLAQNVRQFSEVAMGLRMLTYEQQKRTEALEKQLRLEAIKQAKEECKEQKGEWKNDTCKL